LAIGRNGHVAAGRFPGVRAAWVLPLLGALAAAPAVLGQAPANGTAGPPLVLGQWRNPLPHPLDGAFGTFLLNVSLWLLLASAARLVFGPVLKALARRTRTTLDDKVVDILGTPLFIILFFVGVRLSLQAFALPSGLEGFLDLGGTLLAIVVVAYVVFRAWNEIALVYAHRLAERTHSSVDNRLLPVLEKLGGVVIILFGAVAALQALGLGFGWLLAGGAFASLVIGLAAQDTLSNFFSGLHLLLDQPFIEGDEIQLESGEICTVRKVGLRSSHLYNTQHHDILIVPNNLLATRPVTNLMRPDRKQRVWLDVGVTYGADADQVRRILAEAAAAHPKVLREPGNEPQTRLIDFGPPALRYTLIFWVGDQKDRNPVASDLRIAILRHFKEAGITFPNVALAALPPDAR
jgi:small-conductance mechanosensitive channel